MKPLLKLTPDSAIPGLVILIGLAGAIVAIATCSGCAQYPVALSIRGEQGAVSYSSKAGLEISVEK